MACLGPGLPLDYCRELPNLMQNAKVADFSAAYEQSIAGTAKNVLRQTGCLAPQYLSADGYIGPIMLVQVAVAVAAGIALYRVVLRNRRCADQMTAADRHCEYASAVLFMALSTPHLLLYDAGILAVAMAYLWLTPAWRLGVALLLSLTTFAAMVYLYLGVSLVPLVAIVILFRMARGLCGRTGSALPDHWHQRFSSRVCREKDRNSTWIIPRQKARSGDSSVALAAFRLDARTADRADRAGRVGGLHTE